MTRRHEVQFEMSADAVGVPRELLRPGYDEAVHEFAQWSAAVTARRNRLGVPDDAYMHAVGDWYTRSVRLFFVWRSDTDVPEPSGPRRNGAVWSSLMADIDTLLAEEALR